MQSLIIAHPFLLYVYIIHQIVVHTESVAIVVDDVSCLSDKLKFAMLVTG